jgi:hypothetical protein
MPRFRRCAGQSTTATGLPIGWDRPMFSPLYQTGLLEAMGSSYFRQTPRSPNHLCITPHESPSSSAGRLLLFVAYFCEMQPSPDIPCSWVVLWVALFHVQQPDHSGSIRCMKLDQGIHLRFSWLATSSEHQL